jgi:hypothetical protein
LGCLYPLLAVDASGEAGDMDRSLRKEAAPVLWLGVVRRQG